MALCRSSSISKSEGPREGSRWALVKQLQFVLGCALAGLFFVVNL